MKHSTTAAIFAAGTITGGLLLAPTPADAGHRGVPHRAILMFEGRCPRGYEGVPELNQGRFPRGSYEGRRTGGDTSHMHATKQVGVRTQGADWDAVGGSAYHSDTHDGTPVQTHSHGLVIPAAATTTADHLPPYAEVTFCTPS